MDRILIVEDEEAIVMALEDDLRLEGYEVVSAADGPVGLSMAMKQRYDLIILDVMLPKMDGFEVCRQLRSSGVATPVLMLTAKSQEIDKVLGLELGADDYVTKPFSPRELLARVKVDVLHGHKAWHYWSPGATGVANLNPEQIEETPLLERIRGLSAVQEEIGDDRVAWINDLAEGLTEAALEAPDDARTAQFMDDLQTLEQLLDPYRLDETMTAYAQVLLFVRRFSLTWLVVG